MERVTVDHPAAAQREDLHHCAIAFCRKADHVHVTDRLSFDGLPLDEVLHGAQPIPIARGVLETLLARSLVHLPFELLLDRFHVA